MSRYTKAYTRLLLRLDEITLLLKMARKVSRQQAPSPSNLAVVNALYRSGVVLLSSHVEGYVEDLAELILDSIPARRVLKTDIHSKFKYYLSRDMFSRLKSTDNPDGVTRAMNELLRRDGHIWDSTPHFQGPFDTRAFLRDFSNPKHDKIVNFFGRFGIDLQPGLASMLGSKYSPCQNMIDHVVEERNKIAHGDVSTTGTPTDLENMLILVREYCRSVDCVVANWCRSKKCTIR